MNQIERERRRWDALYDLNTAIDNAARENGLLNNLSESQVDERLNEATHAAYEAITGRVAPVPAAAVSVLSGIDELCQQGLNSNSPAHWEAALSDIMQEVRKFLPKEA